MQEHVFEHPWERVTAANWRKYTDSEHKTLLSHVLEVDMVDRQVDKEHGRMHTTRAITVNAPGPWWLQRLMGETVCHCLEKSTVDASMFISLPPGMAALVFCCFLPQRTPRPLHGISVYHLVTNGP